MLDLRRLCRHSPFHAFLVLSLAAPATAVAQAPDDGTLDEIVVEGRVTRYSALKSDTPILETARSVSIEIGRAHV